MGRPTLLMRVYYEGFLRWGRVSIVGLEQVHGKGYPKGRTALPLGPPRFNALIIIFIREPRYIMLSAPERVGTQEINLSV